MPTFKLMVGHRVMLVISFISLAMLFVGGYNLYNIARVNTDLDSIYAHSLLPAQYLANAATSFQEARVNLDNGVFEGIMLNNISQIEDYKKTNQALRNLQDRLTQYQRVGLSTEEIDQLGNIQAQLKIYQNLCDEVRKYSLSNTDSGNNTAFQILRNQATPVAQDINNAFNSLQSVQLQRAQLSRILAEDDYNKTRNIFVIVITITLVISFGLGYLLSRSFSKPLGQLAGLAKEIAAGDLRRNVAISDGNDEISALSRCVYEMVNNLREFVSRVQISARMAVSSSQQLSANAQETSSTATEAASTVSEIAATMEHVAKNAHRAAELSSQVTKEAEYGSNSVEQIMSQMAIIGRADDNTSQVVDALAKTLNRVNDIVDFITSIGEETNLLALNAAIEAARAGEEGHGFAVVANEVKNLAEQSINAAKDISQLIVEIAAKSKEVVQATAEGAKQVQEGAAVVDKVGVNFRAITKLVDNLTDEIQCVATATEQVSSGLHDVASGAEEQTFAMEEVSCATDQLVSMVNDLNTLVAKYQLLE